MTPSFLAATLLGLTTAQTIGTTPEVQPKLTTWKCTKADGCKALDTAIVLDALRHNIHPKTNSSASCGDRNTPLNPTVCPDQDICSQNCVIEGIQNYTTQAVFTNGDKLRLDMYNPSGEYMSPRVYLLAGGKEEYEMLQLNGNELSFDVNMSKLPCGMNSALYLSEMKADGGRSKLNTAGATLGTGYCDAQCSVKPFINGEVGTTTMFPDEKWLTLYRAMSIAKALAATKWTFGRPIVGQTKLRPMSAPKRGFLDALAMIVAWLVFAARQAAEITLTTSGIPRTSTALVSRLTRLDLSPSSLSSRLSMACSKPSFGSTSRTAWSSKTPCRTSLWTRPGAQLSLVRENTTSSVATKPWATLWSAVWSLYSVSGGTRAVA
jgi:hypothetical protein